MVLLTVKTFSVNLKNAWKHTCICLATNSSHTVASRNGGMEKLIDKVSNEIINFHSTIHQEMGHKTKPHFKTSYINCHHRLFFPL